MNAYPQMLRALIPAARRYAGVRGHEIHQRAFRGFHRHRGCARPDPVAAGAAPRRQRAQPALRSHARRRHARRDGSQHDYGRFGKIRKAVDALCRRPDSRPAVVRIRASDRHDGQHEHAARAGHVQRGDRRHDAQHRVRVRRRSRTTRAPTAGRFRSGRPGSASRAPAAKTSTCGAPTIRSGASSGRRW